MATGADETSNGGSGAELVDGVSHSGRVGEFDQDRGLGLIHGDDGRRYPFHCAAIADGTRQIEPGGAVRFQVSAGLLGQWEARRIIKEVS
ncbi:MAG: hypothetical protein ACYCS7_16645 [Acidimicrobiales bacterium]